MLKQGKHSVGVQRKYTGSAGKITNCQITVSLSVATRTEHLPARRTVSADVLDRFCRSSTRGAHPGACHVQDEA